MNTVTPTQPKTINAIFHFDGGHGWLEVSKTDFEKARCFNKISVCSYQDKNAVYLEEDRDARIFQEYAQKAGFILAVTEKNDGECSPIRRKERFGWVF